MLASYTRLTYSLAVIMLETSQSINLFLPVISTVLVSTGIARCFNRSLYDYAIRSKQMPLLRNHMPAETAKLRIKDTIVGYQLDVVESVCSVGRLADVCKKDYHSIPVVNMAGKLIGLMPKSFIIVLVENHVWYDKELDERGKHISRHY